MSIIDNNTLLLELHNFRKGLTPEQEDVTRQVTLHMSLFNSDETGKTPGQKEIIANLTERLSTYKGSKTVSAFLEKVNSLVEENELFYDLESLYRALENANQGMVYRHPMQVVLNILNEPSDREQCSKILNELSLYDWIPDVKKFLFKYNTNPTDRQNLTSDGGKAETVYSIVEKVQTEKEEGYLTFVGDKWFFLTENRIETTTPSNHISDREHLQKLVLLEKAIKLGKIEDNKITFSIDEGLDISISFKTGEIFLNEEKADKQSTLESVFESPLISYMRRDLYPVLSETISNLDKFINVDVVTKITNFTNPYLECYAFNYNEKMYIYSMDKRYGHHFHEYDSASMLVNEMKSQLGFDLSVFYSNRFSDEVNAKRELEDREKIVLSKISDINENIDKLVVSGLVEINKEIKSAYDILVVEKTNTEAELRAIKGALLDGKYLK